MPEIKSDNEQSQDAEDRSGRLAGPIKTSRRSFLRSAGILGLAGFLTAAVPNMPKVEAAEEGMEDVITPNQEVFVRGQKKVYHTFLNPTLRPALRQLEQTRLATYRGIHDAVIQSLEWAISNPAGIQVDRIAGPHYRIDSDGTSEGKFHPLYFNGEKLTDIIINGRKINLEPLYSTADKDNRRDILLDWDTIRMHISGTTQEFVKFELHRRNIDTSPRSPDENKWVNLSRFELPGLLVELHDLRRLNGRSLHPNEIKNNPIYRNFLRRLATHAPAGDGAQPAFDVMIDTKDCNTQDIFQIKIKRTGRPAERGIIVIKFDKHGFILQPKNPAPAGSPEAAAFQRNGCWERQSDDYERRMVQQCKAMGGCKN
jgi:hypothetical protein